VIGSMCGCQLERVRPDEPWSFQIRSEEIDLASTDFPSLVTWGEQVSGGYSSPISMMTRVDGPAFRVDLVWEDLGAFSTRAVLRSRMSPPVSDAVEKILAELFTRRKTLLSEVLWDVTNRSSALSRLNSYHAMKLSCEQSPTEVVPDVTERVGFAVDRILENWTAQVWTKS
jgi:hypothetical protein